MTKPTGRSSRRSCLGVAGVAPAAAAIQQQKAAATGPQKLPVVLFGKAPVCRGRDQHF
ncbi:MAG TPA: hypothetical protein VLH09_00515 [Bryobacteraceae bacterium]|nr:hypothetical protein [Bryobacteraceae bacterium]